MNYFLTGITGNVGSAIARRLLSAPDARVWALMRAGSEDELVARVDRLFEIWDWHGATKAEIRARLRPLRGDMASDRFGLAAEDWSEVIEHCRHLIHAAGVVRMNLPLDEARAHAVGSANNLMRLADAIAESADPVHVAFVSTVGVAGKMSGALAADWVSQARGFHNTYEQSKAEAEDALRAWRHGPNVHLSVHRPSMVVGASDGALLRHQIFYYICEFLSGCHTVGFQPALADASLDTVPVDYVADAICWAVQRDDCGGRIFNLCSGVGGEVPLATVQGWTRQAMQNSGGDLPRLKTVSARLFVALSQLGAWFLSAGARRRLRTIPMLIEYLHSPQAFEGRETRAYLHEAAGVTLPEVDEYLPGVIASFYTEDGEGNKKPR